MADSVPQLLLQRPCSIRQTGAFHSIGQGYHLHLPYDHFRVFNKIAVHDNPVFIFRQMYPIRLYIHHPVTLFKKQDIGRDLRPGILLESRIGQPDRP